MDPIDRVLDDRSKALLRDIRRDIRAGQVMQVISLIAFPVVVVAAAYGKLEGREMVFMLVAIVIANVARTTRHERLLRRAVDALDPKSS